MTYKELYEKATWLLEHSKISGKEYDKMIEPLNAEVGKAEPVKYGIWIRKEWAEESEGLLIDNYECSACKGWVRNETNYCPNCGAKMDVERKEE